MLKKWISLFVYKNTLYDVLLYVALTNTNITLQSAFVPMNEWINEWMNECTPELYFAHLNHYRKSGKNILKYSLWLLFCFWLMGSGIYYYVKSSLSSSFCSSLEDVMLNINSFICSVNIVITITITHHHPLYNIYISIGDEVD